MHFPASGYTMKHITITVFMVLVDSHVKKVDLNRMHNGQTKY